MEIAHITKRDFSTQPFALYKITNAVLKAMTAVDHGQIADAQKIAEQVYSVLLERKGKDENYIPTVEEVQDVGILFLCTLCRGYDFGVKDLGYDGDKRNSQQCQRKEFEAQQA